MVISIALLSHLMGSDSVRDGHCDCESLSYRDRYHTTLEKDANPDFPLCVLPPPSHGAAPCFANLYVAEGKKITNPEQTRHAFLINN